MTTFSLGFNRIEQTALKGIRQSQAGITQSLTRLSTGKRINSAKDDPAGLIASELLKSENVELRAKIKSTKELGSKYAVTDSYFSQIGDLLTDIKGAVVEGANTGALSDSQLDAMQLTIDYALDSIQRFTQTAEYKGEKLLEGLFGALDSLTTLSGGDVTSSVVNGKIVFTAAVSETAACSTASKTIQTNSLATFTGQLFAAREEEDTGPLAEIAALLQSVANAMIGDTGTAIELPEEELVEDVEETPDEEEAMPLQAETELETEVETVMETEIEPAEPVLDEQDPYEAFFEMEREQLPDAEIETELEVESETVEAELVAVETEAEAVSAEAEEEVEEKKEFDVASTFVTGNGEYLFREVYQYDPDAWAGKTDGVETVSAAGIIAKASTGFNPDVVLENLLTSSYSMSSLDNAAADAEKFFAQESEAAETDEDILEGGRLMDLRSGGSASLREDPAKADRIIDQAIRGVAMMQAKIGAEQKYTIDTSVMLYEDQLVANTAAYAQITDADYAEEMTNLAQNQLLLQMNLKVLNYSRNTAKMIVDMLDASMG